VKVLSPEMIALEWADGFETPVSNNVTDGMASQLYPPVIVGRFEPEIENMR
jgi:hypothetical protein